MTALRGLPDMIHYKERDEAGERQGWGKGEKGKRAVIGRYDILRGSLGIESCLVQRLGQPEHPS